MLRRSAFLAAFLALFSTLPAAGEVYSVVLKNGNTFETRYRPQGAPWNEAKVLLLTDVGNWVAVDRNQIDRITADTETRGFGTVIDTTTIALGWSPNDAPVPGEGEGQAVDPTAQLLQYLQQQSQQAPYSMQQFVEPSATSGLPVNMIGVPVGSGPLAPGAIPLPGSSQPPPQP